MKNMTDGVAVIPAASHLIRNDDVEYQFRQNSDFHYLTGFDEPDAVAVLQPDHPTERYVLFVRPKDPEAEVWTGYRAGVEGARGQYGADAAYTLAELDDKLRTYAVGPASIYYRVGNAAHDARITSAVDQARNQYVRYGRKGTLEITDPSPLLHELRLHKTEAEIELLRKACTISVEGHREAMRFAQPGQMEHEVQAALEYIFRAMGSKRNGYGSILASGANACILHYTENDQLMKDGDLLLIDAGAEYGYYSADITRTFPVNGSFTGPQRAIYEVCLAAQKAGIATSLPGNHLRQVHETGRRVIVEGLVDLGLLPRSVDDSLAMHHDKEFFYHGTSHWLGLDVHDAGAYRIDGEHRPLVPGMAFTVEPGVYVGKDKSVVELHLLEHDLDDWAERRFQMGMAAAKEQEKAEFDAAGSVTHTIPEEFRGIGVRIEDDILITESGHENMTAGVPVVMDEIEAVCAEAPLLPYLG